jgi:MinD-like ATPase involved in chromosome partitioning or flagellar assembly
MTAKAAIPIVEPGPTSRVIFTEGGKGGVGKTGLAVALVDWFQSNRVPVTVLDLDTENKARGSLKQYFPETRKVNIHTPAGLDAFINVLEEGAPLVVADMGSGAGAVAHEWFNTMYESAKDAGVVFTAIGIVTPDAASVESVLAWGAALQDRVQYLIVKNAVNANPDFRCWEEAAEAKEFRRLFRPAEMTMQFRVPQFEQAARQHGVTLRQVAERQTDVAELKQAATIMRAQAYRRNLFAEFDRVKDLLLL